MRRPDRDEIQAAAGLLHRLAADHGLSNLRHSERAEQLVVDVADDRSLFDLVEFESAVEGLVGWRPDVVSSGAPGARPAGAIGAGTRVA